MVLKCGGWPTDHLRPREQGHRSRAPDFGGRGLVAMSCKWLVRGVQQGTGTRAVRPGGRVRVHSASFDSDKHFCKVVAPVLHFALCSDTSCVRFFPASNRAWHQLGVLRLSSVLMPSARGQRQPHGSRTGSRRTAAASASSPRPQVPTCASDQPVGIGFPGPCSGLVVC